MPFACSRELPEIAPLWLIVPSAGHAIANGASGIGRRPGLSARVKNALNDSYSVGFSLMASARSTAYARTKPLMKAFFSHRVSDLASHPTLRVKPCCGNRRWRAAKALLMDGNRYVVAVAPLGPRAIVGTDVGIAEQACRHVGKP